MWAPQRPESHGAGAVQETTVCTPGRAVPGAVGGQTPPQPGLGAFSDTLTLRCAEQGLEAVQVPSPRLPGSLAPSTELWVGKEGRAESAQAQHIPLGGSRWEGCWKHLVPRGPTEGFVWKFPTLGKSPPSLWMGLVTTSSAEGHTQAGCLGSWWGGGGGYREAGSSLPRLPALSYDGTSLGW